VPKGKNRNRDVIQGPSYYNEKKEGRLRNRRRGGYGRVGLRLQGSLPKSNKYGKKKGDEGKKGGDVGGRKRRIAIRRRVFPLYSRNGGNVQKRELGLKAVSWWGKKRENSVA